MLKKISLLLIMIMACGVICGCDSGSNDGDEKHKVFVFINDTGKRIQIYRNGGTEWIGSESFQLVGQGAERSVELVEIGTIDFTYIVLDSGDVDVETSGNTIFFRYD